MAKTIRFTVTTADIASGRPMDPCGCPIALAVKRRFPGETIYVNSLGIQFSGTSNMLGLPNNAIRFVSEFDMNHKVNSFFFDAEIL